MATEKVAKILKAESNFSEEQIQTMSDRDAWAWIYSQRPPKERKENLAQVCFTGFDPTVRAALEARANAAHLEVVKSVTKSLRYLCTGPNAGPSKLEKAKEQRVVLMSSEQFEKMIETGEVPTEQNET